MFRIELVSEASAPLSAAKWFNAKRNNNWMRYDLRLSETLLTPISSWTNEVKAFGTTSETSSIWYWRVSVLHFPPRLSPLNNPMD